MTKQEIYDRFSFLEGLVSEDTYRRIVETAVQIQSTAVMPAAPSDAVHKALERLVHDVRDLTDNSHGVIGLHKNGDDAPWSELTEGGRYDDWLGLALEQADVALTQSTTVQQAEIDILRAKAARYDYLRSGVRKRQGIVVSGHREINRSTFQSAMCFDFWCTPEELDILIDLELEKENDRCSSN